MDWLRQIANNISLNNQLTTFLTAYGTDGLEQALLLYTNMQQEYICKTKTSTTKLRIADIYYLDITGHNIIAHTTQGVHRKYGTLSNELKTLSHYGFVKCNQSCIVSLTKIKSIGNNQIILINDEALHLSRSCAPKVILAFHNFAQR